MYAAGAAEYASAWMGYGVPGSEAMGVEGKGVAIMAVDWRGFLLEKEVKKWFISWASALR